MPNARREAPEVVYCDSPYAVGDASDAIIVVTEWNEFKQLDMARLRQSMRQPVLVDGRNIYEPAAMRALGFTYVGIGRG
jgi:UDPglucose 6-dehydrogenase